MSANAGWKSGPDALTKTPPVWGAHVGSPQVESTDYTPIASDYVPSVPLVAYPAMPETETTPEPVAAVESKPWPKPKPGPKLETIQDIAKEISNLYGRFARSAVDVGDASKLANMLALLARVLETSELEKRVEALEEEARKDELAQQRRKRRAA